MQKTKLWTPNYSLLIAATAMGAAGGIAANFALSFLVFDETESTLAAGLLVALNMVPSFLIPLIAAPWLDRMPRKPFLVGGDAVNGICYLLAGFYLLRMDFSYTLYLGFSLLISSLSAFDSLAYESLYPKLIPEGCLQKGYSVSSLLYPTLMVIMTPVAALLYDKVGIAWILLGQGTLSLLAAITESRIRIQEEDRRSGGRFSVRDWACDLRAAWGFLRTEKGLQSIYAYTAVTNGAAGGYSAILVAFFRTAPGFSIAMYSLFSVVEFIGRAIGGLLHYHVQIPHKKRFMFAFSVYQLYELMDAILLWIPYPLMLVNRTVCGFLGVQSATLRQASVQHYVPDALRAKLNAFSSMLYAAVYGVMSLAVGALGEVMDYRACMSVCGIFSLLFCWISIWRNRSNVRNIYNLEISGEA